MNLKACCANIYAILKRNIWLSALWFAVLFFALPVYAALALQNSRAYVYNQELMADFPSRAAADLVQVFGQQSQVLIWVLMLMAFFSALIFGGYMHKQRQVDFYHSQPPRREKLLLQNITAGLLSVLLPYMANLLLTILVALAMGAGAAFPWGQLFLSLAVHTLYFTAIFATTLVAVILCGNGAVATLLGVFFLAVLPSLLGLGLAAASEFYPVFYSRLYNWGLVIRWLSPAAAYVCVGINGLPNGIIPIIVYDALMLAAAIRLYRRRPSEAAGQAIAFKIARPPLKYAMACLAATIFAFVFHSIGNSDGYFWWYFGAITGGFLATQITEIVYAFDFRAIRRNLRGLAIFLVIYLGLSACVTQDVGGFNSAVPRAEQVASVEIHLPNLNRYAGNAYYYSYRGNYNDPGAAAEWLALERSERDYLAMGAVTTPQGIAAAVNIAARYANGYLPPDQQQPQVSEAQRASFATSGRQYLLDYLDAIANQTPFNERLSRTSCRVVFTLQNGRKMARDYSHNDIPVQFMAEDIAALYTEEGYRVGQLSELFFADENYLPENLEIFELYSNAAPLPRLSMEQRSRLLAALRADLLNLSVEEQQQTMPVGALRLRQYAGPADYRDVEEDIRPCRVTAWPIYASFERTLTFLAELGYGPELWQPQTAAIRSATMIDNQAYREMEKYGYMTSETQAATSENAFFGASRVKLQSLGYTVDTTEITDPAAIAEIMAISYPFQVAEYNTFIDIDPRNEVEIWYEAPDGQRYCVRRIFPY